MTASSSSEPAGEIRTVRFSDALEERYLAYALSTIMARSLPDVRDGLKPVHRRLLFAMRQLRLNPDQGFKKSARVVGDVIGKFHPHGDQAIYDALVRLAQNFSLRYPLIDGQGNFGNVDGDNAAAMRYTEARLTEVAIHLLDGIDEDTVDFRTTYDGESDEPVVLPASLPNLLANGAQGIAVGMASAIPPHNLAELCDALVHLVKHPKATIAKLVDLVPGPDFPTGGMLVEGRESIVEAYKTGRGAFRVREIAPGRENRRAPGRPQARHVERRARRIGGRDPPGARAQEPQRRPGRAHGIAVPPDRPGDPRQPQHERAGCRAHAAGHEPKGSAAGLPRSPAGSAVARHALPT
jgi:topoisomerase-4 subunit A